MSNIDKAIEVLNGQGACCGDCLREPGDPLSYCGDCARCLSRYAQALADAGLLMPDLPEPDSCGHDEYVAIARWGGTHMVLTTDISTGAASETEVRGGVTRYDYAVSPEIVVDVNYGELILTEEDAHILALALLAATRSDSTK